MHAVFVVVANIFRNQPLQMAFIHCDDVVQQVTLTTSYPTLRDTVMPGTLVRGSYGRDLEGSNGRRDFCPILAIPIEN